MHASVNGGVRIGSHFNKNAYIHEQTTIEFGVRIVDRKNLNLCTPFSGVSQWFVMHVFMLLRSCISWKYKNWCAACCIRNRNLSDLPSSLHKPWGPCLLYTLATWYEIMFLFHEKWCAAFKNSKSSLFIVFHSVSETQTCQICQVCVLCTNHHTLATWYEVMLHCVKIIS